MFKFLMQGWCIGIATVVKAVAPVIFIPTMLPGFLPKAGSGKNNTSSIYNEITRAGLLIRKFADPALLIFYLHNLPPEVLQRVLQLLIDNVGIEHGRGYRHVAKGLLHQANVFSVSKKIGGIFMALMESSP